MTIHYSFTQTLMMMGQKTALLAAAMHDRAQVVKLLVDRGAELLPPHYVSHLYYILGSS